MGKRSAGDSIMFSAAEDLPLDPRTPVEQHQKHADVVFSKRITTSWLLTCQKPVTQNTSKDSKAEKALLEDEGAFDLAVPRTKAAPSANCPFTHLPLEKVWAKLGPSHW